MRENNLFILKGFNTPSTDVANKAANIERWHQRLGHNNTNDMENLEQLVHGTVIAKFIQPAMCVHHLVLRRRSELQ